jgi:nucleotide-binding universal stress UspA family protein
LLAHVIVWPLATFFAVFRGASPDGRCRRAVIMIAIRRILCPVDFSRFSRHALEQAVALARETGAEVVALHACAVAPVTEVVTVGAPIPLEPARFSTADHLAIVRELRDFTSDVETGGLIVDVKLCEREPVAAIVDTAERWSADLIVMGTHGRAGFERLLLGSVAEKVLRKAPCPVLTVPSRLTSAKHGLTFSRILCAVDFSPASLRALAYAASLAASEGPGVTVLNVIELFAEGAGKRDELILDTPDFRAGLIRHAQERLHTAISEDIRRQCPITETVAMGKAWREVLRVAHDEGVDLIVLGVQGRTAADLMLFGSTTQHVVRQAACPVLTIRA